MIGFDHKSIDRKWRMYWEENQTYKVVEDNRKEKYYVLDMFPYPSGAGLHVGHPLGYIASDIISRHKRMCGYNVLHPMGFDAFGLPAEEYAIQTGIHPAVSTQQNMKRYREQMALLGFSFDWDRMVDTSNPSYYKWTQWIFTLLFQHYYDLVDNKAKPIHQLQDWFAKKGSTGHPAYGKTDPFTAYEWAQMTPNQKSEKLMQFRLAYRKVGYVNWCEALGTVLANDQIKDGISVRGGHPVEKKAMTQWWLRITSYAERLLNGLEDIDWSDALKLMQSNWIGRSEGAQVFFDIKGFDASLEIYTTRIDTIFGATFMVLAPEHPYIDQICTQDQLAEVDAYRNYVSGRSERERMADQQTVGGAFTGAYCVHPFTEAEIPIWISEYVLMDYGTGAIMAVPSDDERDMRFAKKFDIPIVDVVDKSKYPNATLDDKVGVIINSDFLNGLEVKDAIAEGIKRIEAIGKGKKEINYKLRDANFGRQRYWGEPFPIVYDENNIPDVLPLDQLPLELPNTDNFKPGAGGVSPIARLENWIESPYGRRETDTMPAVAGSSWYFLRYMDPKNNNAFASAESLNYWQDVDLYIGGAEHAVAHLLYARFWHKFLFDLDYLPTSEPFKKLINQGMIQGVIEFAYLDKNATNPTFISATDVDDTSDLARIPVPISFVSDYGTDDSYLNAEGILKFIGWNASYESATFTVGADSYHKKDLESSPSIRFATHSEVGKMSKSKYNVINPDTVVDQYGADCFRMYEMFLGPLEHSKPWDTQGIEGVYKFIRKLWLLFYDETDQLIINSDPGSKDANKVLHTCIKNVRQDIDRYSFNTCISHFMVCVNNLRKLKANQKDILDPLVRLIAPFAPHISEELWSILGNDESVHRASYPNFDPSFLVENTVSYPICINGKKRLVLDFDKDATQDDIKNIALNTEKIQQWIANKEIRKVIVVPNRMVNIVI